MEKMGETRCRVRGMNFSLPQHSLQVFVEQAVSHLLPDGHGHPHSGTSCFDKALERVEHCFQAIHLKYYNINGSITFNHLHADHMATLLYLYANTIWHTTGDDAYPIRLCYANKIMHGLDLHYNVEMPEHFLFVHPIGTVLGRAIYGDYLAVYQGVTVGALTTTYPTFGSGTILYANSSVLGNSVLGDDVIVGAHALVRDIAISAGMTVTGQCPRNRFHPNTKSVRQRCFDGQ